MYAIAATMAVVANLGLVVAHTQINVDARTIYQTIDGFGFSEAFGFGEAAQNAPIEQQNQAVNYMFSTTEGAGMTILRNRVAADPADTIEPNSPGSSSGTPTYVWNGDDQSQVFWSKKAREMGVKYIYGDAWSAPGYMKTNDDYVRVQWIG